MRQIIFATLMMLMFFRHERGLQHGSRFRARR